MEDFDLALVSKRSIQGIFALVSRTLFVQILSLVSNFILTLYLDPSMFGIFFVVSAINVFLAYFQDIGLAALIIQKKEEPNLEELRTTFTIQQILVLLIIIPTVLVSPKITEIFHITQEGIYILYAYLFSFFLSSLKTIPTVLLERKLAFHRLVIPQIAENAAYSLALIYFAINGYGIQTFTYAILIRSVIGLPLIYIIQPWRIGFAFKNDIFKRLVSHGSPFQANSILALIKDDLLNLYVASLLPIQQMGYIGFGQKWAFQPLRLIMDNVIKVTFPAYSRLQHDKAALRKVVEKSFFLIAFFMFPIVVAMIMFASFFIDYIPRYQKWHPAIIPLIFFSFNALFASVSVPLTNFLNAVGKVKITLRYMVFWTILSWVLTWVGIKMFGYIGVPIASAIVAASVLLILLPVKKALDFSFIDPIKKQAIAALLMAIFIYLSQPLLTSLVWVLVMLCVSGFVYGIAMYLLAKGEVRKTVRFLRQAIVDK